MTGWTFSRRALLGSALAAPAVRLAQAQGEPYVMGTLFPMSGPNAEYGEAFTRGAQLALSHIAADSMLRRPVRLQAEDSQALPQPSVVGMNKLINVDRAVWVLVSWTATSKAVAPIGDRARVIMVNGGAVGPDLSGLSPYFWNVIALAHLEVPVMARYLTSQRNVRRVALIYVDDPLGEAILAQLRTELPRVNAELVGSFSIPRAAQQFGPVAARVRQTRPDAVYIASFGAQQSQIIKGLRDNGVTQIICSYSAFSIDSVRTLPEAEGVLYTTQKLDFESGDPVTRRFASDFRTRHNMAPLGYHANYYNAAYLFGLLARQVEQAGGQVNGDTLREAMLATRTFDLVGGRSTFDEQGNLMTQQQVNEIRGQRVVVVQS
ncbi:MAG TPA: ABC transporter substrate-binding protein [Acetobacteraceae bacterium]|nr:ABC transporter substrate-binding protein [Acetobacteraceae bacterium]